MHNVTLSKVKQLIKKSLIKKLVKYILSKKIFKALLRMVFININLSNNFGLFSIF